MSRRSGPPWAAAWMLELFAPEEQAECVAGDLSEEFSAMAARSSVRAARRWYWRQTFKSCWHLLWRQLLAAPWSTAAWVWGGLLLLSAADRLTDRAAGAILLRYAETIYARISAHTFWVGYHVLMGGVIEPLVLGWLAARIGRRGVLVPLGMTIVAGIATIRFIARGPYDVPVSWGHLLFPPVAILAGGVLGRISRARKRHMLA